MHPPNRHSGFQAQIGEDPATELTVERLRDGRIAIGTRTEVEPGKWRAGELILLGRAVQLDLAAWLTPAVEAGWIETVRQRQREPLQTAVELYGEGPGALHQLAHATLAEIPAPLLVRALVLLANSIGPHARERLIERLNETANPAEEAELRRRLLEERESFAYTISAAALFDALARDLQPEDLDEG